MTGGIGGYEYGVTCPVCGEYTDISMYDDPSDGVECVGWWNNGEYIGCGQTLLVRVAVVEDELLTYHDFMDREGDSS
jgi:hypothetical protein